MTESRVGKVRATRLRDGMKEKVKEEEEKRKGKWRRQRSAVASQA